MRMSVVIIIVSSEQSYENIYLQISYLPSINQFHL